MRHAAGESKRSDEQPPVCARLTAPTVHRDSPPHAHHLMMLAPALAESYARSYGRERLITWAGRLFRQHSAVCSMHEGCAAPQLVAVIRAPYPRRSRKGVIAHTALRPASCSRLTLALVTGPFDHEALGVVHQMPSFRIKLRLSSNADSCSVDANPHRDGSRLTYGARPLLRTAGSSGQPAPSWQAVTVGRSPLSGSGRREEVTPAQRRLADASLEEPSRGHPPRQPPASRTRDEQKQDEQR